MIQQSINYAKVLLSLPVKREDAEQLAEVFNSMPELTDYFMNPVITRKKKYTLIEEMFEKYPDQVLLKHFLCELCRNGDIDLLTDIMASYEKLILDQEDRIKATIYYVTKPEEDQIEKIKTKICEMFDKKDVQLTLTEQPDLIGGFVIRAEGREIDWSLKGKIRNMKQIWSQGI